MPNYFKLFAFLLILLSTSLQARPNRQALPDSAAANRIEDTLITNQENTFKYGLTAMAIATSNKEVPFWMRSNQFGSIPLDGPSLSLIGRIERQYNKTGKKRLTDWGVVLEPRLNVGRRSELLIIEGYAKGRLGIFQFKAGRSRDIMGLVDSTLSSGAFAISGNSLGIPKVELSIPEYWDLPFLNGILAIKGNFAHGWLGNVEVKNSRVDEVKTYYHQKSFYARLGKPNWRLKIFAGFNHQAFWGNERILSGTKFALSKLETFKYVVLGKGYGGPDIGIPRSKIGNHLGSIDQAIEFSANAKKFMVYHQFLYDVGGLYHLNNIKDGVFGLSISNNNKNSSALFRFNRINFEFINTKSQGGEIDAKITPSGDEDYYNNFIYNQGWSYKGENLGNPLVTSKIYARKNLPVYPKEFFINNRIRAFHTAAESSIEGWSFLIKATYSLNYGTYGTSPWGHSLSSIRIPTKPPYFQEEGQFSGSLEIRRKLANNLAAQLGVAFDRGSMLYNSSGIWLKMTKNW